MGSVRQTPLAAALGIATVAVLLLRLGPAVHSVSGALDDPQAWVDRVGADAAALTLVAVMCWLALAWFGAGMLLVLATSLPGVAGRVADAVADRLLPSVVRRTVVLALGMSLGTAVASGVAAAEPSPARPSSASIVDWPLRPGGPNELPQSGSADLTVDWPLVPSAGRAVPATRADGANQATSNDRGDGSDPTLPGVRPATPTGDLSTARSGTGVAAQTASGDPVVVMPGDSLWLIAASRSGPAPTATELALAAERWYATNQQIIGPDPDLLQPGEVLLPPP